MFLDEKPDDHVVTLHVKNVPESVRMKDLQRKMAADGHVVLDYNIENNVITNQRNGEGLIHVRAKTGNELSKITGEFEANGMKVDVGQKYKPVWKR